MPLLHRNRTQPAGDPAPPAPGTAPEQAPATGPVMVPDAAPEPASDRPASQPGPTPGIAPGTGGRKVPVTRTSVAWTGVWAAVLVTVAFIVFLLQNTAGVKVSFLGMHATLPLAVGLLIAMVAGVVLTLIVGTARITQLRRLARRRRRQDTRR
jgi:uncharacterized integral membrane protein